MSEARNARRYALYCLRAAEGQELFAIRDVWLGKLNELPGTALPTDFPLRTRLAVIFYTTYEDLDGADCEELADRGFSRGEADKIFKAFAQRP